MQDSCQSKEKFLPLHSSLDLKLKVTTKQIYSSVKIKKNNILMERKRENLHQKNKEKVN